MGTIRHVMAFDDRDSFPRECPGEVFACFPAAQDVEIQFFGD